MIYDYRVSFKFQALNSIQYPSVLGKLLYFKMSSDNQEKLDNRERIRTHIKRRFTISLCQISLSDKDPESPAKTQKSNDIDSRSFENFYTLLDKIGSGGNGVVKKCKQIKTGKIYAVKISQTSDEELVMITKRTYQIIRRINHQNIIRPKYLFINENTSKTMLVMEYCPYPSLKSIIYKHNFSEAESKLIIKELLIGIQAIHSSGVCHRDIKPDNILYDLPNHKLKIIDFGISKRIYHRKAIFKQKMWTPTGSIYYKAPEMFVGTDYDESIDCWAVGITAYQLIFKKLPFYSEWQSETIQMIESSEPNYEGLQFKGATLAVDFIRSLLKKQPSQRAGVSQALRHPWIENQQKINRSEVYLKSYFKDHHSLTQSSFSLSHDKSESPERMNNFSLENDIFQIEKNFNVFESTRSSSIGPNENQKLERKPEKKFSLELASCSGDKQEEY